LPRTTPKPTSNSRLKLLGFNNLTKSLSFNIYDICYASSREEQQEYIEYIDEQYNAERLTNILTEVADIIGANILNVATEDYDPQGASVTMLISEGHHDGLPTPKKKDSVVAHLDKSHITVHTYPETHPDNGISTFRADIDVSTCGKISPLKALNFLIKSFESDIVVMDYRVRGFTRNVRGMKHFIDHNIDSIQNFIAADIKRRYQMVDVNVYQESIYHTKMCLKELDLDTYLFGAGAADLTTKEAKAIRSRVDHEIQEIFYGRNIQR
jgi:S-adenosylmethionine decarboxylase